MIHEHSPSIKTAGYAKCFNLILYFATNKIETMFKVVVIFALACVTTSDILTPTSTKNIGERQNYLYLGNDIAIAEPIPAEERQETIIFPNVSAMNRLFFLLISIVLSSQAPEKSKYIIRGIKYENYQSQPASFVFNSGGIGSRYVNITLKSPKGSGLRSIFHFYGEKS